MKVGFKTKKLQKQFEDGSKLEAIHGSKRAKKIRIRLKELRAAESLQDLSPPFSGGARCHELPHGKRKGQISVDLDHPYRLIFTPGQNPAPEREEGGLDWSKVDSIIIIGIEDTHG